MTDDLHILQQQIDACQRCVLAGYPVLGPPIYSGNIHARLMLIGQAPGKTEAGNTLKPFSGSAGKRLFRWLGQVGWEEEDFRERFYISSVTKCFPGPNKSGRGDRAPSRKEQLFCSEWLDSELMLIDPEVVIPVGRMAIERFFGRKRKLVDLIGIRFQIDNRIVVPLPHPSGASAWIQKPAHKVLISRALQHLVDVRNDLGL